MSFRPANRHKDNQNRKCLLWGLPLYPLGFTLRKHPFVPEIPAVKSSTTNRQMYHIPKAYCWQDTYVFYTYYCGNFVSKHGKFKFHRVSALWISSFILRIWSFFLCLVPSPTLKKIHSRVRTGKTISLAFSFRTCFHCSLDTRVSCG